uniref:Skin secreted peptide 3 n=1 Tax=Ascaphus truei TaxID=8439 RepID=SKSP3_ASCTR|nr:RecName: Full=Skin secreted peptide 3 [Ascaphus truei]
ILCINVAGRRIC